MKNQRFWALPWLCLCLICLLVMGSCAVNNTAAVGNTGRLYRFNLILLPGYDQTVFASVNSNDIGAELFSNSPGTSLWFFVCQTNTKCSNCEVPGLAQASLLNL
ncbi:hypothetical protein [Mucilaginibacter gracilis]|uniref:hypothetical protein n=1 Tax=Mucilaginibacter gracilis TaxID=423350 RepID=UPI0011C3A2E0|nr:hypothetical protein [Mucilaginibacter gracilis]